MEIKTQVAGTPYEGFRPIAYGFPVSQGDELQFDIFTITQGTFCVQGVVRVWKRGHYQYIPFRKEVVTAATKTTIKFGLVDGELVSAAAWQLSGVNLSSVYGATFVRCKVQRTDNPVTPTALLFQDYLTTLGAVGFPGGNIVTAPTWDNVPETNIGSLSPAAGAEISFAVPADTVWIVENMIIDFVTSATVANRRQHFRAQLAAGDIFKRWAISTDTPASTTVRILFDKMAQSTISSGLMSAVTAGVGPAALGSLAVLALNGLRMNGVTTDTFASTTTNIQAGDQYTVVLRVRRAVIPDASTF